MRKLGLSLIGLILAGCGNGFEARKASSDYAGSMLAKGRTLTPVEVYHRCYSQMTQSRVPIEDARLRLVKNGTLSATEACLQVLNSARLTADGNTRVADLSSTEQKQVVRTFQNLHQSWFAKEVYFNLDGGLPLSNYYDTGVPAAYFTRALLNPNINIDSVLTEKQEITLVRSVMNPSAGAYGGASALIPGVNIMAPVGEILGVRTIPPRSVASSAGNINLSQNFGAGFITSMAYLLTSSDVGGIEVNGASLMARVWSRSVLKDTLCRELPVVRTADAVPFVVSGSEAIAFRRYASCTACHASMDRMAATIRNLKLTDFVPSAAPSAGTLRIPASMTVTEPAETQWPHMNDYSYHLRPPNGVFYFRTYDGKLINAPVANAEQLAGQILATEDFYNCVASRYYQYFLGIKTEMGDIQDPSSPVRLSEGELFHRSAVINLGKSLRSHKNVRQLIKDIVTLPYYSKSDFGSR